MYYTLFSVVFIVSSSLPVRTLTSGGDERTTNGEDRNGCLGVLDEPCRCNKYIINCTNAGFRTTEIFLQITDAHFPDLDTLILTGNHFPELETRLFGPATFHKRLSKLYLSNNTIKSVHAGAFQDLPRLEELSLNDNQISVDDVLRLRLFDRLKTLKILQLERAFDTKNVVDPMKITHALNVIFGPKSELTALEYLQLQGNRIQTLNDSMFCNLPVLEFLYLQNNSLPSFNVAPKCLTNLVELHLENNKIARLTKTNYERLNDAEHLQKIFLSGNPIECTGEQNDFIKWLKSDERILYKNETYCATALPTKYKSRSIMEIDDDSLKSESDGTGYMHGVYIICGVAIVGLMALLFCLFYANRRVICARSKSGLLLTTNGYEVLNKEPEVKAEMV